MAEAKTLMPGVTITRGVLGGAPCVEGTRLPTRMIATRMRMGDPDGRAWILDNYELTDAQIDAAMQFESGAGRWWYAARELRRAARRGVPFPRSRDATPDVIVTVDRALSLTSSRAALIAVEEFERAAAYCQRKFVEESAQPGASSPEVRV